MCFVFRRKLYAELFEYDMPLMHPEPKVFSFLDSNNSEYENPWKESLRQLVSIFRLSVIRKRTNTKQRQNKVLSEYTSIDLLLETNK